MNSFYAKAIDMLDNKLKQLRETRDRLDELIVQYEKYRLSLMSKGD